MTWRNTKRNGIKPIPTTVNNIQFDSRYEAGVYLQLVRRYGSQSITTQHPLLLKPETGLFKKLEWKVDFKVHFKGEDYYYEAKGFMTEEFRLKMQLLEWRNPYAYSRLIIVCHKSKRLTISRKLKLPLTRVITKADIKSHDVSFIGEE